MVILVKVSYLDNAWLAASRRRGSRDPARGWAKSIVRASRVVDLDLVVRDDMSNASARRDPSRAKRAPMPRQLAPQEHQVSPRDGGPARGSGSAAEPLANSEVIGAASSVPAPARVASTPATLELVSASIDDFSSPRARRESRRALIDASRGVGSSPDISALDGVEGPHDASSRFAVSPPISPGTDATPTLVSRPSDTAAFYSAVMSTSALRDLPSAIARELFAALGGEVVVEDTTGAVSHRYADPQTCVRSLPQWRGSMPFDRTQLIHLGDWTTAVVTADGVALGAVSVCGADAMRARDVDSLCLAAAALLSLALSHLNALAEAELRLWGDLASELLEARDAETSRRHASLLGIEVARPFRAIAIELVGPSSAALIAAVRRAGSLSGVRTPLLTLREKVLLALVSDEVDWPEFGRILARELGTRRRIGVGRSHPIEALKYSADEAMFALSMSTAEVAVFDDLGLTGLLSTVASGERLREFVREWIGCICDYDEAHRADLVATLREFLRHQGALAPAARALFVHPSTVKYRMHHIRELLERNLEDPDVRFNVELSCHLLASQLAVTRPRR